VKPDLTKNAFRIEGGLENTLNALDGNRMIGRFFNRGNNNTVGPTAKDFLELVPALSLVLEIVQMKSGRTISHVGTFCDDDKADGA
jgi:hypothetical protein